VVDGDGGAGVFCFLVGNTSIVGIGNMVECLGNAWENSRVDEDWGRLSMCTYVLDVCVHVTDRGPGRKRKGSGWLKIAIGKEGD